MKYIAALLLFFYTFPGCATEVFEIVDLGTLCEETEAKLGLKNVFCRYSSAHKYSQTTILIGDYEEGQVQEAILGEITTTEDRVLRSEPYNVRLISLGHFYAGCMWVLNFGLDHVLYMRSDGKKENHGTKYSANFNLIKVSLADLTHTLLASGLLHDVYGVYTSLTPGSLGETYDQMCQDDINKARQAVQGKMQDIGKMAPILANPTEEMISAFIKTELGKQDLDISYSKLTTKTGLSPLVNGVILVTQHGIPALEEAFFLSMKTHSYFLRSLGKFSCDTFDFLVNDNDSFMCTGKSVDLKNFHFLKSKFNASSQFTSLATRSAENQYVGYAHERDFIFLVDRHSLWTKPSHDFEDSYREGVYIKPSHDLEGPYLIDEGDWENIINTRFKSINGRFYQITPSEDEQKYVVYTLQNMDGRYQRIPTNVRSTEYIHTLISDSENAANILAYQTGTLSQLTWRFCDKSFEEMVSELSFKINSNLGELQKYSWHFSQIPFGDTGGQIEFDEVVLKRKDKEIKISCDASGKIGLTLLEGIKFIPLAKPEMRTTHNLDLENFLIDYAVFRSPNDKDSALPTVMIIAGGPHLFIEHKEHAEKINFFNHHGYHV